MANISISDILPVGSSLLLDNESYIEELNGAELNPVSGGTSTFACATVPLVIYIAVKRYHDLKDGE